MKAIAKLFVGAIAVASTMVATSCAKDDGKTYDVTFYDNETVLKTESVKEGECATDWTPVKEGFEFVDWYATPNYKFAYDFAPVYKDTPVYALFQSTNYVEDTRPWAIVGNGTSKVLSSSAFGKNIEEEHMLTRSDKKNVNEYTITLDLEVGDEFQFAIDSNWSNQRGGGYLDSTSLDGTEYFEIKASHLNTETRKCNIGVLVSGNYTLTLTTHPGDDYYDTEDPYYSEDNRECFNYSDFDKITWVRNGDVIEQADKVYDLYIKGNLITGWQHIIEPEYKMDYDPATKTYTYTHEFFDFDEFMFYSLNGDSILDGLGPVSIKFGQVDVENSTEFILGSKEFDSNFTTGANGTYTFTYSLETRVCVVTYDPTFTLEYVPNTEWYIVGGGCSELLSISDWGRKNMDERFKLMPVEGKEREYAITIDLQTNDEFQIVRDSQWGLAHGYSFLKDPVLDGTTYFANTGNIQCKVAGNYTLTLSVSDVSKRYDVLSWVRNGDVLSQPIKTLDVYYKLDTHNDWEPTMIGSVLSNGDITFTLRLEEGNKFCFVYTDHDQPITDVYPGNLIRYTAIGEPAESNSNANFSTNLDRNFVCDVAGTYDITIDYSSGAPVVNAVKVPDVYSYDVYIKGTMTRWEMQNKTTSVNGVVEFDYTFAEGDEFGFVWFDENTTTAWGNWIGTSCLGTEGDANEIFNAANNFKCTAAGTYRIKIVKSDDNVVTVDFFAK